jgi:hypothetical protein
VNLLSLVSPPQDATAGTWTLANGVLTSDKASPARIEFPYRPPVEYDLRIVFTRNDGPDGVYPELSSRGYQFDLVLGGLGNTLSGLETIKG